MASSKPKKSGRRRRPGQTSSRLESLKQKLAQGPFRDHKFVVEPAGAEKMSEVLSAFVAPFVDATNTKDDYHRLLTLAVVAWNAALLPEAQRPPMLDELLIKGLGNAPASLKKELREFVGALIVRKLTYFPDNQRAIVDFSIEKGRSGYHLTVVSTLEGILSIIRGNGGRRPPTSLL